MTSENYTPTKALNNAIYAAERAKSGVAPEKRISWAKTGQLWVAIRHELLLDEALAGTEPTTAPTT